MSNLAKQWDFGVHCVFFFLFLHWLCYQLCLSFNFKLPSFLLEIWKIIEYELKYEFSLHILPTILFHLTTHVKLKAFVVLLKRYIYTTYKSSFIFQIYLVDDSTGSIPSFIWFPAWTWMETTVEFCYPPWIIWDIPSPWLFLRQANLSNSTDILIHAGTDRAAFTITGLERFLSSVWLHINKCFLLRGYNWRTWVSLWDSSTGQKMYGWHQPKTQTKLKSLFTLAAPKAPEGRTLPKQ